MTAADTCRACRIAILKAAEDAGLSYASEVFADRAYNDEGKLFPRDKPGAVLHDTEVVISRALMMIKEKKGVWQVVR